MKLESVLVANRGEISLRVQRTARRMGLRTVAVYSEADRDAPHVRAADEAVCIGGPLPRDSYLNLASILEKATQTGARSVHPGYGFLAESAAFAQAVLDAGLVWIGPPPEAMRLLGDKQRAKRLARKLGLPALPGYEGDDQSDATLARAAREIGCPLVVKAAAGGGGRGMRLVRAAGEFAAALGSARSEAGHAFGDSRVLLEKAVPEPRHVEIQVFADTRGNVVHLGERDCSLQRRHQKLVEESPSPALDAAGRAALGEAAVALARAAGYAGAGTIEFLLDAEGRFWFMEANTRLQVEHPVTEAITGLDLVEWQLRVAAGEPLPLAQDEVRFSGHAIEARLCAEDPVRDFVPQSGRLLVWRPAGGVRIEHALEPGIEIPPYYDSMIAKLIVHGATREAAREKLAQALDATVALGLPTNKAFLAALLRDEEFARGGAHTEFLSKRTFPVPGPLASDEPVAAALLARASGFGEWTGWSNNPEHGLRVRFGGKDLGFRYRDLPGIPENLPFAVEGQAVYIAHGGRSPAFENTLHAPPAKRAAHAGDGRLAAPMNGRVVSVHAKAGERVEAGQPLVVLEAMKMEHGLSVPVPVTVKCVHVRPGIQVSPGHLLVEFVPA